MFNKHLAIHCIWTINDRKKNHSHSLCYVYISNLSQALDSEGAFNKLFIQLIEYY